MYNNNINEIHKFPSFVFGEINSHQTWGVQMGTIRGYSVHKPRNISRDYPPTHCWLKCPFQGKQAAPPLQPLKRWKTQTLGALETTLDNIRNRLPPGRAFGMRGTKATLVASSPSSPGSILNQSPSFSETWIEVFVGEKRELLGESAGNIPISFYIYHYPSICSITP